jgi:putative N6-adenine-specific DNA methylase
MNRLFVVFTAIKKPVTLCREAKYMNDFYSCYASSAFGMEGLVSGELKSMHMGDVSAENGGVRFTADGEQLFLCNLKMHFCDRIFILLCSEKCTSFDQLFHLISDIDWSRYFSGDESIDVSCKCVRSMLMSPRDCQSVTKKAIIETIRHSTGQKLFPESGFSLSVHITIRNDQLTVLLNTSGEALSRRGYRTWNGEAPLRETLAAALVQLSGWKPGQPLHDPCCGTGTILTEAALIAAARNPGQNRSFAMEHYKCFHGLNFSRLRSEASYNTDFSRIKGISGSDIDPAALELAERHIRQAGIGSGLIPLEQISLQDLNLDAEYGVFICNPPYGERLSDQKQCHILYHDLNLLKQRHPTWRLCAISSDPAFERSFGRKAARKRRLYNGRLECVYYIYE